MKEICLSPSKLGDFIRCPRCFWIGQNMGIKPPRGIFPSLPGGIDRVCKVYFDKYRGTLPPELKDKVPGVLMEDMETLSKWRNWRSGLKCSFEKDGVSIRGALDDCLVIPDAGKVYIPIDNKTKGNVPKDDGRQYYQTQLDCYNLMLRENGYRIIDEGYLVYWYPEAISENGNIKFGTVVYHLPCDADRGKEMLLKAAECIRGDIPAQTQECELCAHISLKAAERVT